ncbi:RidA family protein [Kitasatospora nipponensis]|uniref:RidA family protein n=1 Tax=Kitasatospora nipponensis TaxID=258049 RepID=A0ABP4GZM2_9ACTN
MSREIVSGPDLPVHGPYSPAVRVGGLLFVSAQPGLDPATGAVPAGGVDAECRQALRNLERVLTAGGSGLALVARTTLLYTDPADLPAINAVYAEFFPADPPARSAAVVTLAAGRRLVVDAIAAVADGDR